MFFCKNWYLQSVCSINFNFMSVIVYVVLIELTFWWKRFLLPVQLIIHQSHLVVLVEIHVRLTLILFLILFIDFFSQLRWYISSCFFRLIYFRFLWYLFTNQNLYVYIIHHQITNNVEKKENKKQPYIEVDCLQILN